MNLNLRPKDPLKSRVNKRLARVRERIGIWMGVHISRYQQRAILENRI